tara:strand:+ start:489 stop:1292 length:804 start_codon:yes stop_codon:yes gene_type:complete
MLNYYHYHNRRQCVSSCDSDIVLVISPHPDDEVLGMGGTIAKHLNNGSDITILYMTDGRNGGGSEFSSEKLREIRRSEAQSFGEKFGLRQVFWNIPDVLRSGQICTRKYLENSIEIISTMVELLNRIRPNLIYITSFFDFSVDHFTANKILADALEKVSSFNPTILGYEVWNYIPLPNYIVNVSKEYEDKEQMMMLYQSQLQDGLLMNMMNERNKTRFQLYSNPNLTGFSEAFLRLNKNIYIDLFRRFLSVLRKPANVNRSLQPYIT